MTATEESSTASSPPETNTVDHSETEFVVLSLYWDEWSRCIGSRYQRDSLYRVGRLDTCSRQWKDLKVAARAKVMQWKDPKGAQTLIDNTYYKKRTTVSPTAGAIWELKEKPGWD